VSSLAEKFNALVQEQDRAKLRGAVKAFRPLVIELESVAEAEAKAWLKAAASGDDDEGAGLAELSYQARRKVMEEATAEAEAEADRVEARNKLLAGILEVAGDVGLLAAKLLFARLTGGL